jgi:hypothetical protein
VAGEGDGDVVAGGILLGHVVAVDAGDLTVEILLGMAETAHGPPRDERRSQLGAKGDGGSLIDTDPVGGVMAKPAYPAFATASQRSR